MEPITSMYSLGRWADQEKDAQPEFPFTCVAARDQGDCINLEKESQQQPCKWPSILVEANEFAGLQEMAFNSFNPCVLPEERKFHRGGRHSSRFKFSFRSSSKQDVSWACSSSKGEACNFFEEEDIEVPEEQDFFEHRANKDAASQLLEDVLEESFELDNKQGFHKQLVGATSVSELLEDMHKTNPTWRINLVEYNIKGKTRQKSSSKKISLYIGDRALDDEDAPESTDEFSFEDEDINHGYQKAQLVKAHTMADVFQDAFNTSTEDATEIRRSDKIWIPWKIAKDYTD